MKRNLILTLVFAFLLPTISSASISDKRLTCTDYLTEVNEKLEIKNQFATNDVFLSAFFGLPIALLFPPAALFPATVVGFKVAAMVHVKNSHDLLDIFAEARNGGGKKTQKLYRKIMRSNPKATLTYQDLLEEIYRHDLNGEGCQDSKYPNKKEIISVIELEA